MRNCKYFGLTNHGEQIPFEGYIIEEGLFAVRQDKNAPVYQKWKIDHLPSGYYASYAATRKEAIRLISRVMQVSKEHNINLNNKNLNQELNTEHRQLLKNACER